MQRNLILISILFSIGFAFAQDSTFVSQYELTGFPWDNFFGNSLIAENVIDMYDGSYAMQTLGTYITPPPEEYSFFQSPIFKFTPSGMYENVVLGPLTIENSIINGNYSSIIQDRNGGYLALDTYHPYLHSLDSLFHFNHIIHDFVSDSIEIVPQNLYEDSNGYIITGYQSSVGRLCAKFDYNNNVVWSYKFRAPNITNLACPKRAFCSDGGYLFWVRNLPHLILMKVSQSGDSLWSAVIDYPLANGTDYDLIEINNFYYFARYDVDWENSQAWVQIVRFQLDSTEVDVLYNFPVMSYNGTLELNPKFLILSDGNILLTASLENGQLNKFDSNMNLLWSTIVLPNQAIVRPMYMGRGQYPTRELPDGDLITCASTSTYWVILIKTNSQGQVTAINEDEVLPAEVGGTLFNYPNPFNPTTTINYTIRNASHVNLTVYNVRGQKVAQLVNENMQKGTHNVVWDGKGKGGKAISSGVYLYRLTTSEHVITRKMILMK
jgi:hypothetical protein